MALSLVLLLSIESFAAVVGDNDGAAFITKAEFDSLKSTFQEQINRYNKSIDNKIDGAIASYLAGVNIKRQEILVDLIDKANRVNSRWTTWTKNWNHGDSIVTTDNHDMIARFLILYKNTTSNNWMLTTNDALWAGEGRFWGSNQQSQPNTSPGDKRLVVEKYSDATGGDSYYIVDNKVVGFRHRLDCNDSSFYSGNVSYSAAVNTTNYTFGRMLFPQKTASAVDWQGNVGGYARDVKIWHVCDKVEYDEEYQNIFYIPAKPIDKRYFTSVLSTMNVFDGELITNVEADSMYRSDFTTQASAYSGYGCAEGTKVQKQRMYFDYYDNKIFKLKPTDYLNLGATQALGKTVLNGDGLPICSVYQSGQVEFTVEVTDRAMVVISNGKFNHLYDYGDAYSENILAKETVDTSHKFVINDVNKDDVLYLKCLPLDVTNVQASIVGEIKNLETD